MAVTRSWAAAGAAPAVLATGQSRRMGAHARTELRWLVCASLLVAAGLGMVFVAKTHSAATPSRSMVNLNTVTGRRILP